MSTPGPPPGAASADLPERHSFRTPPARGEADSPRHDAPASQVAAGAADLLAQAAARVRAKPGRLGARALSAAAARERLDDVVLALESGRFDDLVAPDTPPAERSLCRHLIDLLRRELLDPEQLDHPALPTLLHRLEVLRSDLEPEWHEALVAGLTGMDALDLVVELAHDLRSPLTSIMFLAETLRKARGAEPGDIERQQLEIIYSAALNLSGIVSDLIDLARGDAHPPGADSSAAAPFSVSGVLERVRGMVAPMAAEKELALVINGPAGDGRIGDAVALGRVLLNLTTNALKFTESGRIEVRAVDHGAGRVEFSVTDTGRGMDAATIATLFEPFRRSRSRSGFQFSGTGLGLAITRRILERMGSELRVESELDRGTRFSFELQLPEVPGADGRL
jgi:signal transduction histidine kinase